MYMQKYKVSFNVNGGKLYDVNFSGDFFSRKEISGLNHALNGVPYDLLAIFEGLEDVSSYIVGATPELISSLFFK